MSLIIVTKRICWASQLSIQDSSVPDSSKKSVTPCSITVHHSILQSTISPPLSVIPHYASDVVWTFISRQMESRRQQVQGRARHFIRHNHGKPKQTSQRRGKTQLTTGQLPNTDVSR